MNTSHHVAERLILIKFTWAVIWHGAADREEDDIKAVLAQLDIASEAELEVLPKEKRASAERHAKRATNALLEPFIDQGMSCAKAGLIAFHAIQELVLDGVYDIDANPAFDQALIALTNEKGTVVEVHNIDGIDRSAQKHAKRMIGHMQRLGYFLQKQARAA